MSRCLSQGMTDGSSPADRPPSARPRSHGPSALPRAHTPVRTNKASPAELPKLTERLQIPVASSASGLGALASDHPLEFRLVSRGGVYQANHATRQADVLLALGVRFDDRTSSSWLPGYSFTIPPTKLIHVDIDPDEIARNYPVALGLMADVRTFLRQVLAELDRRKGVSDSAASRAKWL